MQLQVRLIKFVVQTRMVFAQMVTYHSMIYPLIIIKYHISVGLVPNQHAVDIVI